MKILVTGANGQLGNELKLLKNNIEHSEFEFTDVEELDITNKVAVNEIFNAKNFDILINCAAYTAVDKAEEEPKKAYNINAQAVEYLAKACKEHQVKMIHISTDYVFDGRLYYPYREEHLPAPESVYGETKFDGESEIVDAHVDAIILRTSWLYSSFGNNFVKTILRLGKEKESLNIVFDQIGTPTYAGDLALAIVNIINDFATTKVFHKGIFHFSNEGVASWYDFAVQIVELAKLNCKIFPIETKEYPTLAKRPHFSVLNKNKFKHTFSQEIPHWTKSLQKCITLIMSDKK